MCRANAVSCRSGASARRISSRLIASISARPPAKIDSSRTATSSAFGENTSAVIVHAAASTAALPMARRQKSAGPREGANTDFLLLDSGATGTPAEACSRGSGREHAASETVGDAGGPYVHVALTSMAVASGAAHTGNPVNERGGNPLRRVKDRRRAQRARRRLRE